MMETKILTELPKKYERNELELTEINEGWVTEDKETFKRLLRKETFYYVESENGRMEDPNRESTVVIEELESIKGTAYMKRKIKGTLFDDVQ